MAELKTKYKYITFHERDKDLQGKIFWECRNKRVGGILGEIEYYPDWRQWVIAFDNLCVFNHSCLTDIAEFLKALNAQRKCGQKKQALPSEDG